MFLPLPPLLLLLVLLLPGPAAAWNAHGHRLIAAIAWQQMSPSARTACSELLARHPDHADWQRRSRSTAPEAIFSEAATWADAIRDDPRYYDEGRDPALPPPPGLIDNRRHKHWHYVDRDAHGQRQKGELDRRSEALLRLLQDDRDSERAVWALPWLLHLIGDLHQPLHTGQAEDEGGNRIEIENPFDPRQPFINLHSYWDNLPGRRSLRGERLFAEAARLQAAHPPPRPGRVADWHDESRRLLRQAYPDIVGSLLPSISRDFHQRAGEQARRRLVDAGYRLGWSLEAIFGAGVPRETAR